MALASVATQALRSALLDGCSGSVQVRFLHETRLQPRSKRPTKQNKKHTSPPIAVRTREHERPLGWRPGNRSLSPGAPPASTAPNAQTVRCVGSMSCSAHAAPTANPIIIQQE